MRTGRESGPVVTAEEWEVEYLVDSSAGLLFAFLIVEVEYSKHPPPAFHPLLRSKQHISPGVFLGSNFFKMKTRLRECLISLAPSPETNK